MCGCGRYENLLEPKDTKTSWISKIRKPIGSKRTHPRRAAIIDTDRHRHRPSTNHKIHPHPPHRTLGVSNRLCIDNPNRQSVIIVIVALKLKLSVVPTTQRLTLKHPLSIVSIRHDARELRRNIVSILCESAGLTDFHCGICLNSS